MEQTNSNNDKAPKTLENLEELAQVGGTLGNSEDNKTMLENPEKPARTEGTLSKRKNLKNLEKPAYAGRSLSKPGKNIESVIVATPKASALVIPAKDSNFNSLYTSYIISKQTQSIIQKPMTEANKKLKEVYVDLWGPHYPLSLLGNIYAAILVDINTRKSWVKYL